MNKKEFKQQLLNQLYKPFENCQMCPLGTTRKGKVVFGSGNPDAKVLFIGEAPGRDEDIQGKPFVGRSGQLLTKCLEAVGIERDNAYITNIVKCRPPENRMPAPNEASTCMGLFLFKQIKIIQPKIICTLGSCAFNYFMNNAEFKITQQHGKIVKKENLIILPTFHPAYILRNKNKLHEFVSDLEKLQELISNTK